MKNSLLRILIIYYYLMIMKKGFINFKFNVNSKVNSGNYKFFSRSRNVRLVDTTENKFSYIKKFDRNNVFKCSSLRINNTFVKNYCDMINSSKTENEIVRGSEEFIYYYNLLNDEDYLKKLVELEKSKRITDLYNEIREDKISYRTNKNKEKRFNDYNDLMLLKYLQEKNLNFQNYLKWLQLYSLDIDKKYLLELINIIIDQDKFKNNPLEVVVSLSNILEKLLYRNFKLLDYREKMLVKNNEDLEGSTVTFILKSLIDSNWKTNDENFGNFFSKYLLQNNSKFDFNDKVLSLIAIININYITEDCWNYLDYELSYCFKSLYKSKSMERITEAFTHGYIISNKKNHINILEMLKENILKIENKFFTVSFLRSMIILTSIGFITDKEVIQELKSKISQRTNNYDFKDLILLIDCFYYLEVFIYGSMDKYSIKKLQTNFNLTIENLSSGELSQIIESLVKYNMMKYIVLKESHFEKLIKMEFYYHTLFQVLHNLTEYDQRWEKHFKRICNIHKKYSSSYHNTTDLHVSIVKYLKKYQYHSKSNPNPTGNLFYKFMLDFFENEYINNVDYKLLILTFPIFKECVGKEFINKIFKSFFIKKFVFDRNPSASDDLIINLIIQNQTNENFTSSIDDVICVDIEDEKAILLKQIKDFGNFSISEMESLYQIGKFKVKFNSSFYEKILWH